MKKELLLSLALCAAGFASQASTNIYVANMAGWNEVTLYSWGDDTEIFGAWPGAAPSATETISGVTYDKFVIGDEFDGKPANLILNNNNNGSQVDLASITVDGGNYYYATNGILVNAYTDPENPNTNFEPVSTFVYAIDNTGWADLYVYGWGTNAPEIFGGWPGASSAGSVTLAGDTYKKYEFPGNGYSYNLIFNDNNGSQFDGPSAESGKDIYVKVNADNYEILPTPGVKTYNIYIDDKTGWDNLYVYAYNPAGAPELLGGWPGAKTESTEVTIDGVTYNKVILNVEENSTDYNFIFNNNDGTQYDIEGSFTMTENLYFTANPDGGQASGIATVTAENADEEYFTLQGVRVMQPANGIFICRKGDKISKIIR